MNLTKAQIAHMDWINARHAWRMHAKWTQIQTAAPELELDTILRVGAPEQSVATASTNWERAKKMATHFEIRIIFFASAAPPKL